MGLFSSSDPTTKQEKLIEKEAKGEEKNLKQAIKDVAHAEKDEHKAAKGQTHAQSAAEKAHNVETKLAGAVNKATQKHDSAVSKQHAAEHDAAAKADAHNRAVAALEQKKANLENIQGSHHQHEAQRQQKLDALHHPVQTGEAAVTGGAVGAGTHNGAAGAGQGYDQPTVGGGVGQPGVQQGAVGGQPGYANDGTQIKQAVQHM